MSTKKGWWYPFKISGGCQVPFTPGLPAVESETKPPGNYWGPYHCKDCAELCGSFGVTESQSYDFNHGSADQKFGVFLGG
jgi:hypothetical protein